jgi:hypothetical protein
MADTTSSPPVVTQRCWSCDCAIDPADKFCPHCGVKLRSGPSPSVNIHGRLVSIEKMLLKIAIGVAVSLALIGWILLQIYHFGHGGVLGDLQQTFSVALDRAIAGPLLSA